MSITIIRPGKIKQPTTHERQCVECDCVFRYEDSDTISCTVNDMKAEYIRCPECNSAIIHFIHPQVLSDIFVI